MYEYRKSIGGWSIDKKIGNSWVFWAKYSTKKACLEFINKQNNTNQLTLI